MIDASVTIAASGDAMVTKRLMGNAGWSPGATANPLRRRRSGEPQWTASRLRVGTRHGAAGPLSLADVSRRRTRVDGFWPLHSGGRPRRRTYADVPESLRCACDPGTRPLTNTSKRCGSYTRRWERTSRDTSDTVPISISFITEIDAPPLTGVDQCFITVDGPTVLDIAARN